MKSLDPLRAKKIFIRKKLGHTAVSSISLISDHIYLANGASGKYCKFAINMAVVSKTGISRKIPKYFKSIIYLGKYGKCHYLYMKIVIVYSHKNRDTFHRRINLVLGIPGHCVTEPSPSLNVADSSPSKLPNPKSLSSSMPSKTRLPSLPSACWIILC